MSFAADIRQWPTVDAFAAHLAASSPSVAAWASAFCLHHTWTPTVAQWRGITTVKGTRDYYINVRKWDAGPHLFICGDAPDPAHRGIFQLTPLSIPGIHAGKCNARSWGCEVVGRYDDAFWSDATAELVYGVIAALYRWRDLDPQSITGHRLCLNNKTCPGNAVVARLDTIRAEVAKRMDVPHVAPAVPAPVVPAYTAESTILGQPRARQDQAAAYILQRGSHGEYTAHEIREAILATYWQTATLVGVDPVLAIAQMIHETGNLSSFWAARPQRNPAGIGVNGRASFAALPGYVYNTARGRFEAGIAFPSWSDAAQAHIGRLLAYATKPQDRTDVQQALATTALRWRDFPAQWMGYAPMLKQLGKAHHPFGKDGCGWASPGTLYGESIATIANAITRVQL